MKILMKYANPLRNLKVYLWNFWELISFRGSYIVIIWDLGFSGCKFTWSNLRGNNRTILERLDRVTTNNYWIQLFLKFLVRHLPHTYSDHYPLLILLATLIILSYKPFRLETMWTSHSQFSSIITNSWLRMNNTFFYPKSHDYSSKYPYGKIVVF